MLTSSSTPCLAGEIAADPPKAVASPWVAALANTLAQLDELLERLTDEQYVCAAPPGFSSGIGPHVRHCLDHVAALIAGAVGAELDYDRRIRGTVVESDRQAARELLQSLHARLLELENIFAADLPVRVSICLSPESKPVQAGSTLGRELAFVQSHTIHHQAILAALVAALGIRLPVGFGVAPATLAYQARQPCALFH